MPSFVDARSENEPWRSLCRDQDQCKECPPWSVCLRSLRVPGVEWTGLLGRGSRAPSLSQPPRPQGRRHRAPIRPMSLCWRGRNSWHWRMHPRSLLESRPQQYLEEFPESPRPLLEGANRPMVMGSGLPAEVPPGQRVKRAVHTRVTEVQLPNFGHKVLKEQAIFEFEDVPSSLQCPSEC